MDAIYRCASTSLTDGQKRNQKDILILNKIILVFMSAIYLRNTLHGSLRKIIASNIEKVMIKRVADQFVIIDGLKMTLRILTCKF